MARVVLAALAAALGLGAGAGRPTTPVISAPHEAAAGLVTFGFAAREPGVRADRLRYQCAVDARRPRPCTSPYDAQLKPGKHVFRVQAIDPRGRQSGFGRVTVQAVATAPSVRVGIEPVSMIFAANALWTADWGGGTVTRVERGAVTAQIRVGGQPGGVAFAGGSIWVSDFTPGGQLTRIDPATNKVVGHLAFKGQPAGLLGLGDELWVADYAGAVVRVDAAAGAIASRTAIPGKPEAFTSAFGLLWVTNEDGTLTAVDPTTGKVSGARVVGDPDMDAASAGPRTLWSTSYGAGTLLEVDPASRRVVKRVKLGGSGGGVLALRGAVWASVYGGSQVVRVDPVTGRILHMVPVGNKPRDIVSDGTSLWVVNQGSGSISRLGPAQG